jgi:hypothetical protein
MFLLNVAAVLPLLLYMIIAPAEYPSDPDSAGNPVNCTWAKMGGSPSMRTTRCRDMPVILLNTVIGLWLPFYVFYMLGCCFTKDDILGYLKVVDDNSSKMATYIHEMHKWDGGTSGKPGLQRLEVYPPKIQGEAQRSQPKPKSALGKVGAAVAAWSKKGPNQRKLNEEEQAVFVERCKQVGGELPPLVFQVSCSHEEGAPGENDDSRGGRTVTTFCANFPLTWQGSATDNSSFGGGGGEQAGVGEGEGPRPVRRRGELDAFYKRHKVS